MLLFRKMSKYACSRVKLTFSKDVNTFAKIYIEIIRVCREYNRKNRLAILAKLVSNSEKILIEYDLTMIKY